MSTLLLGLYSSLVRDVIIQSVGSFIDAMSIGKKCFLDYVITLELVN